VCVCGEDAGREAWRRIHLSCALPADEAFGGASGRAVSTCQALCSDRVRSVSFGTGGGSTISGSGPNAGVSARVRPDRRSGHALAENVVVQGTYGDTFLQRGRAKPKPRPSSQPCRQPTPECTRRGERRRYSCVARSGASFTRRITTVTLYSGPVARTSPQTWFGSWYPQRPPRVNFCVKLSPTWSRMLAR
jgi:hypothetical protein